MENKNIVLETIAARRSVRAYTPEPVTADQIDTILRAGLQSPSARNAQPWKVVTVTDAELLQRMNATYIQVMADSGRNHAKDYCVYYNAPVVVFVATDTSSDYGAFDCGLLTQNIVLAAQSIGLNSLIVGLWHYMFEDARGAEYKRILGIPESFPVPVGISIGHGAESPAARPRDQAKFTFYPER